MELKEQINQPLRFYTNLEDQLRFESGYSGKTFNLYCPINEILPFQIKKISDYTQINEMKYIAVEDGSEYDIDHSSIVEYFTLNQSDYFVCFGGATGAILPEGEYYVTIDNGVSTWYSEVLTMRNFDPENLGSCVMTKITYWDTCDTANILYRTGANQYKNTIYLDVPFNRPEYSFEEEGEEDGEGRFRPEFIKFTKQYLLQSVFPEYMVDALSMLPLHTSETGVINIESEGYEGVVDRISVSPEWQGDYGLFALTNILFNVDLVTKTNCCKPKDDFFTGCVRTELEFTASLLEGSTDYVNREYTDAADGVTKVPLADGDLILVEANSDNIKSLKQYVISTDSFENYPEYTPSEGSIVTDFNEFNAGAQLGKTYYYYGGSIAPGYNTVGVITELCENPETGRYNVKGLIHNLSRVEVYLIVGSQQIKVVSSNSEVFRTTGVDFDILPGAGWVYVEAHGATCKLSSTGTEEFQGVGYWEIGTEFTVS